MRWHRVALVAFSAAMLIAVSVPRGQSGRAGAPASDTERPGLESIWALQELPDFHITLSKKSRQKLRRKPRKWVKGSFRYRSNTYEKVGVRLKGHRSFRKLSGKAAFKIRFDKYVDGQRLRGVRRLTLNNLVEDATMVREVLAYRLMRAMNVPAPNAGYARVFVDGELYGLYLVVETVDEDLVSRAFDGPQGELYEGEYGCDLYPDDVDGFDHELGSDRGRSQLRALASRAAQGAHGLFHAADAPLDKPAVLAYLAVSAVIGDFDGYRHAHNYRIYHHPASGKWSMIPWGLDRVFKKRLSIYDSHGLLARRCFADARCRREYVATTRRVAAKVSELRLREGAEVIKAFIAEAAASDPRRPYGAKKMARAHASLVRFLLDRPAEIRAQSACLDEGGRELDRDGDGFGCLDVDDTDPKRNPAATEICDGVDNNGSGLVDDSPACACKSIVADGVTFQLCDLPMTWQAAAKHCAAKRLSLARIDSAAQSRAVYIAARQLRDDRWWIGATDRQTEGTFTWADGSPMRFVNWSKNEPDNSGCNQDCAALAAKADGRWQDTHCAQPRPFVCR